MSSRARLYLTQMAESLRRIEDYAHGGATVFYRSPVLQDAIVHNLEILGESVKQLPPDLLASYPLVEWSMIARMRDRLAHHYLDLDLEIVWEVVQRDLPAVKVAVEAMMRALDS